MPRMASTFVLLLAGATFDIRYSESARAIVHAGRCFSFHSETDKSVLPLGRILSLSPAFLINYWRARGDAYEIFLNFD